MTRCPDCGKTFGTVESETIGIVAEDEEKKQKSLLEKKHVCQVQCEDDDVTEWNDNTRSRCPLEHLGKRMSHLSS